MMKNILTRFIFAVFSFLGICHSTAVQTTTQQALWYGYTLGVRISSNWWNETEFMERHLINPIEQSQFLIRTRFHKKLSDSINFGFGGSLFLFYQNGSMNHPSFNRPELRPHGEVNLKKSFGALGFENRIRIEARYFQNLNSQKSGLEEGCHFTAARIRYRLQAIFPMGILSQNRSVNLKIADEIMAMLGGDFEKISFDQNRISLDLSIELSPRVSLDFGYVNWYQAKSTGGYLEQHIIRTVLKHQINFAK